MDGPRDGSWREGRAGGGWKELRQRENYCWAQDTGGRSSDRLTGEEEPTCSEIRGNQSV